VDIEYYLAERDIYVDSSSQGFRERLRSIVDQVFEEEHVKASLERHERINKLIPQGLPDHIANLPRKTATTTPVEGASKEETRTEDDLRAFGGQRSQSIADIGRKDPPPRPSVGHSNIKDIQAASKDGSVPPPNPDIDKTGMEF
jgi:hypothetical protein